MPNDTAAVGTKRCSSCFEIKLTDEFDRRGEKWKSWCKDCRASRERGVPRRTKPQCTQVFYEGPIVSLREAVRSGANRYFIGMPCPKGHLAERATGTRDCIACRVIRDKIRRASDPERSRACVQRWKSENKERVALYAKDRVRIARYNHNRRARKLESGGTFSQSDISDIRSRQKDRCAYCKVSLQGKGEIDHIKALSKGGSNDRSNLQLLCAPCNRSKHDKDPITFMRERGFLL